MRTLSTLINSLLVRSGQRDLKKVHNICTHLSQQSVRGHYLFKKIAIMGKMGNRIDVCIQKQVVKKLFLISCQSKCSINLYIHILISKSNKLRIKRQRQANGEYLVFTVDSKSTHLSKANARPIELHVHFITYIIKFMPYV